MSQFFNLKQNLLSLFVALICVWFWNKALRSVQAPHNDLDFLQTLRAYPDREIANAATITIPRHIWYLAEHLAGVAFFDEKVDMSQSARR